METEDRTPSNRRRSGWVAVVLAVLNPAFSMLYVGRPRRAAVYLSLTVLSPVAAFYLARNGLWPAGFSWVPFVYLIVLIGMVDAYRIARAHATDFTGPWFTTWKGLCAVAVSLLALIFGFRVFVFEPFRTPSVAMLPTLQENDQFFLSKLTFRNAPPQRGDVIVFRLPANGLAYVKRVIGLPGDVVVYDQSSKRLTINGLAASVQPLGAYSGDPGADLVRETIGDRSHLQLLTRGRLSLGGMYNVPDGHYFVLGDHRDNSRQSF